MFARPGGTRKGFGPCFFFWQDLTVWQDLAA